MHVMQGIQALCLGLTGTRKGSGKASFVALEGEVSLGFHGSVWFTRLKSVMGWNLLGSWKTVEDKTEDIWSAEKRAAWTESFPCWDGHFWGEDRHTFRLSRLRDDQTHEHSTQSCKCCNTNSCSNHLHRHPEHEPVGLSFCPLCLLYPLRFFLSVTLCPLFFLCFSSLCDSGCAIWNGIIASSGLMCYTWPHPVMAQIVLMPIVVSSIAV